MRYYRCLAMQLRHWLMQLSVCIERAAADVDIEWVDGSRRRQWQYARSAVDKTSAEWAQSPLLAQWRATAAAAAAAAVRRRLKVLSRRISAASVADWISVNDERDRSRRWYADRLISASESAYHQRMCIVSRDSVAPPLLPSFHFSHTLLRCLHEYDKNISLTVVSPWI